MSTSLVAEDECEAELRDMVAEALENNGLLPKIRAQLRASVFLVLDETGRADGDRARRFQSAPLRSLAADAVGRRSLALVRELLACLQLDCTLSVLDAELDGVQDWREERPRLAAALGLQPADGQPLLTALLAERRPPAGSGPGSGPGSGSGSGTASGGSESEQAASQNGDGSASEEEDSFFDSLPKLKSTGLNLGQAPAGQPPASQSPPRQSAPGQPPPGQPPSQPPPREPRQLEPVKRRDNGDLPRDHLLGDLPPLTSRGTLPPLRSAQLPGLKSSVVPSTSDSADGGDVDDSISEDIDVAEDSIVSELQSDGLTEDVSINSTTELKADIVESM